MASIVDQQFLIQRETTAGTAAVNAMRSYQGLRGRPGFSVDGDDFKPQGSRAATSRTVTAESGEWDIEAIHDYNALLPVCASALGIPVTTSTAEATAYQHVMTLPLRGAAPRPSFTVQFGDANVAFQATYGRFQGLDISVERGDLSVDTALVSRLPSMSATLATTGVTTVRAEPIAARSYDIYFDDAWDDLGTTQFLKCYHWDTSIGDVWEMDAPINSAFPGFEALVEAEDVDYTGEMQVGINAAAQGLFTSFTAGSIKYVRLESIGALIGTGINYRFTLDTAIQITAPGTVDTSPDSSTAILPFDFYIVAAATENILKEVTLVNTVATL